MLPYDKRTKQNGTDGFILYCSLSFYLNLSYLVLHLRCISSRDHFVWFPPGLWYRRSSLINYRNHKPELIYIQQVPVLLVLLHTYCDLVPAHMSSSYMRTQLHKTGLQNATVPVVGPFLVSVCCWGSTFPSATPACNSAPTL